MPSQIDNSPHKLHAFELVLVGVCNQFGKDSHSRFLRVHNCEDVGLDSTQQYTVNNRLRWYQHSSEHPRNEAEVKESV